MKTNKGAIKLQAACQGRVILDFYPGDHRSVLCENRSQTWLIYDVTQNLSTSLNTQTDEQTDNALVHKPVRTSDEPADAV